MAEIIGYIAAVLTTLALVPQVVKIIKTKDTKNLSLYMYIVFVVGIASWFVYGILITNYAIIFANAVTLILGIIILLFKIYNVSKGEKP
ncbi:MAG: SemiSWEET transporter [Firmicutes bacterium]|nr:SemiSWEET transporter [Bacillota bacterium]